MERRDTVVIGAGAAGLMAALELTAAGHDVQVIEARQRVGGRARTVRFPDGRLANAGAEWVNPEHREVLGLAERYGLGLRSGGGFEALVVDGRAHVEEPGDAERVAEALEGLEGRLSDLEHPWDDPVARGMDRRSATDWMDSAGLSPSECAWTTAHIRAEYMVEPEELSELALALGEELDSGETAYRIAGGTAELTDAMARELGQDRIRRADPVRTVEHGRDGVVVRTDRHTVTADRAVIAVPLPALERITLDPVVSVPSVHQGRGGKLLVPYAQRPDAGAGDRRVDHAGFQHVYDNAPEDQPGLPGILTAYAYRPLPEQEVLDTVGALFPELGTPDGDPVAAWWSEEPESGCTYSALGPGDLDSLRRLREPFGRLYLAGEHTEIICGYLESALRSGRRVAARITSG
ncbi:putative flavin-containing monoamine oxidase AofH [Nocardiopsis kunsanensis]|uniref:Flavin-containing monoamine oxidase AofH n=1 Tax=Nocardiopsis kunsanensis TaxID=141693 RepID=A0A918XGN0_9ACTN|nr:NAD(P)/FAD-dependent oxidoreductase [Nocardiopsis kunsanensis]GHD29937.1 putative flavin-containing monoamine oxidase AofH [Nocardiopsis kunsanensis]